MTCGRTRRSAPTTRYDGRLSSKHSRASLQRVTHPALLYEKEATACGRTNHSPQSKEQSSERLGDIGAYKGNDLPCVGGRTGAVDSSSPTHKGSINQEPSSIRGSFGALPLRPTAMIRRTSTRSLFAESSCGSTTKASDWGVVVTII